jgi:regulatory protein
LFSKYSNNRKSRQSYSNKSAGFYKPAELSDSELRVAAINLLSRREYSRHELFQKLEPRSKDESQVQQLLDKLVEAGYQSDQRFAESFLRSRINRGLGHMRIARELNDKGIDADLIEEVMSSDTDWFQLAYDSGLKKSQSLDFSEYKDKQKLFRYLAYRGFSMDQIQHALEQYQHTI